MIISLTPLGDLSKFIKQDGLVVPNTAYLINGSLSIPCSGTILAARSLTLEKYLSKKNEIPLIAQLDGMTTQIYQCLELLYGGGVNLDITNIPVFMLFSIWFNIDELFNLCTYWMECNGFPKEADILTNLTSQKERSSHVKKIWLETDHIPSNFLISGISQTLSDTENCMKKVDSDGAKGTMNEELSIDEGLAKPEESSWIVSKTKPVSNNQPVSKNPKCFYRPNLSSWRDFTSEEMFRLCSSSCDYSEFAKIETALFWIAEYMIGKPHSEVQILFETILENIDPLALSNRYLGILDWYMDTWKLRLFLPSHLTDHIQNPFEPDDPKSKARYIMNLWNLSYEEDIDEVQKDGLLSFFSPCLLCGKSAQETVLKLKNGAPCYEKKVHSHRRKSKRPGVVYPVHFHSTDFHWLIKYGPNRNHKLVSLFTHDSKTIKKVIKSETNIKVICLQAKIGS